MARALQGEGEPLEHVAQTLVNRWAWLADLSPGRFPTLTSLIRAYAQPVNPEWFPLGAKQLAWEASPKFAALPAVRQQLERAAAVTRRDVHSTRTKFSPRVTAAVNAALRGPIVIAPGSLEYAPAGRTAFPVVRAATSSKENTIYGDPKGRGLGALYSILRTGEPWGEYVAAAATAIKKSSGAAGVVVAVVATVAAGAFAFTRSKRK